jgi:uncharacterized membrane protein YphA (DoxX/SURF4 family)
MRRSIIGPPETAGILHATAAIAVLRILAGLPWLDSALIGKDAKLAPGFLSGAVLSDRITTVFAHAALPGMDGFLTSVVLPHVALFAVLIALADTLIAVSLLFGIFSRVGATIAIVRAATNIAVAAGLGADAVGYNALLIAISVIIIVTAAGRRYGVDWNLAKNRALRWAA